MPPGVKCSTRIQNGKYAKTRVCATGADFYACVQLNASGKKVAWMQWNHPNMVRTEFLFILNGIITLQPWDATEIWTASVNDCGAFENSKKLLGDGHINYMQPMWGCNDKLFVV